MPSQSLIAVAILLGLVACIAVRPDPPVWPSSFEVSYTITLPYTGSVQPTPLKYPVHVWYDGKASLMRVSFYDGLDDMYVLPGAVYNLYPRISKKTCMFLNTTIGPTLGAGAGDAGGLLGSGDIPSPLPDISGWQYAGTALLPGKAPTYLWQLTLRSFEKVATYTFHVGQRDNRPIHLDMLGVNLLTGSHFDHYVVDFGLFQPLMSSSVFKPPTLCNNAKMLLPSLSYSASAQAFSALPSSMAPFSPSSSPSVSTTAGVAFSKWWQDLVQRVSGSEAKYALAHDLHTHRAGRPSEAKHASPMMSEVLTDNLRFILEWNEKGRVDAAAKVQSKVGSGVGSVTPSPVVAPEDLFTMSPNKFVMWSDKQWQETVFGHRPESSLTKKTRSSSVRSRLGRVSAHLGMFERQLSDQELPTSVDWRGTGADGPVKDQASCGSCWAFATTGAMTGAWYLATNTSISFSEQQIVDCSWDYSVNGCWGGNVEPALQYIHEHGGVASESSYPYKGQNSWCRENQTVKAGVFKGFKSIPEGDELALMEAVATHGPVAIAFDAVHPTFKYYSEGVYYREDCGQDLDHLNHAVTLVGYGTTPGGTEYWLLRNSWSQYWGDGGYFKMARKGNDCGVTLDAVVAVVDQSAVDRMMRLKENKQQVASQWSSVA